MYISYKNLKTGKVEVLRDKGKPKFMNYDDRLNDIIATANGINLLDQALDANEMMEAELEEARNKVGIKAIAGLAVTAASWFILGGLLGGIGAIIAGVYTAKRAYKTYQAHGDLEDQQCITEDNLAKKRKLRREYKELNSNSSKKFYAKFAAKEESTKVDNSRVFKQIGYPNSETFIALEGDDDYDFGRPMMKSRGTGYGRRGRR